MFPMKASSYFRFITNLKYNLGDSGLHMKDIKERKASMIEQICEK